MSGDADAAPWTTFSALARRAFRLLLPADCTTCGTSLTDDPQPFFCRSCWALHRPLHAPWCPRCHRPFASPVASLYSPAHECSDCRTKPPAYTQAWSLYPYCPPLQDAIVVFKYRGKSMLASHLASLMIRAWPNECHDIDLVMPVPLHPARLRTREFNQSLLLADHISQFLRKPLSFTCLVRTLDTDPQTTLPRHARKQNLRRAFHITDPDSIRSQRIVLIDDVFTTGATVNECSKALRKAGAGAVFVVTLARTLDPGLVVDSHLPAPVSGQRAMGEH